MNDRELLELAARAVGLRHASWYYADGCLDVCDEQRANFRWNPLTDDGDALRLAVRLSLFCKPEFAHYLALERFAGQDRDDYHAHRRAIVRAAAAIRQAPEPGEGG